MATTARDHTTTTTSGLVKVKRRNSLPNSRIPNPLRKSLSTSTPTSDRKTTTRSSQPPPPPPSLTSSPSSSKNVPNYLKSTVASCHEALKNASKMQPLQRRRSLDKSLSSTPSRVATKSINSPVHSRIVPPVRFSSFSPKTTTTTKTQRTVTTRTPLVKSEANSSTKGLKKSVGAITTTPKKEKSSKKVSIREVEAKPDETLIMNPKSDKQVNIDSIHEEDKEQQKSVDVLSLGTSSEDPIENPRENAHKYIDEEETNSEHTIDREFEMLHNQIDPEESLVSEDTPKTIGVAENDDELVADNISENIHPDNDEGKIEEFNNNNDHNTEAKEGNEVSEPLSPPPVASPDVEANDNGGTPSSAKGGGGWKKESPAAYNTMIEETTSKLLEKRKNKVKALVGAFETVIDCENAANNSK